MLDWGGMYWINDYQFSLKGSAKAIQYLMGED